MRSIEFLEGASEKVEEALKLCSTDEERDNFMRCFFHLVNKALIYNGENIKVLIGPDYVEGSLTFAVLDGERRLINGALILHQRDKAEWSFHT